MLTTATPPATEVTLPPTAAVIARTTRAPFIFVAERLWLDFVNTDGGLHGADAVGNFDGLVAWLETAIALDGERAHMMRRRAIQQPSGATAALVDARRVRAALRSLAERGAITPQVRLDALAEINRVLGRSAGTFFTLSLPMNGRDWNSQSLPAAKPNSMSHGRARPFASCAGSSFAGTEPLPGRSCPSATRSPAS